MFLKYARGQVTQNENIMNEYIYIHYIHYIYIMNLPEYHFLIF